VFDGASQLGNGFLGTGDFEEGLLGGYDCSGGSPFCFRDFASSIRVSRSFNPSIA